MEARSPERPQRRSTRGYGGDGGAAIEASLSVPINIVIDGSDNFYVSDLGNNRVRKIDVQGIITTIAGTGEATVSGDGGPALGASLCDPTGLAMDAAGSIYVAGDCGPSGHHVRKIDTRRMITTVAGIGSKGYSGDGGPAIKAEISVPSGLAIGAGGILYVADVGNRCIRAVDADGVISSLWCAG